jgi:UDP-GlcNAc3NAcA epimerase
VDTKNDFILCTIPRPENTDDKEKLTAIFEALEEISQKLKIVLPLHPRTKKKLEEFGIRPGNNIQVLAPVGYFEMIWLLSHCNMVITDSGGLQKEAFFFKKPCITAREQTEWTELVSHGVNFLTGSDKELILETVDKVRTNAIEFNFDFYGDGASGKTIVDALLQEVTLNN